MSGRLLEKALDTAAVGSMKSTCSACQKRFFCQRMEHNLEKLRKKNFFVWDLEHRLRFQNILKALGAMGYEFPDGIQHCDLSEQSKIEINALLQETQSLLIEINMAEDCGEQIADLRMKE